MTQRFYEQYKKEYLPIIRSKYLKAKINNEMETIEKLKTQLFNLKSIREWQKESLWNEITK